MAATNVSNHRNSIFSFLYKTEAEMGEEFKALPNEQFEYTPFVAPDFSVGLLSFNSAKNRYGNILPNDATRVKLQGKDNDYINANHCLKGRCIISQGPKDEGANGYADHHADFFHMLWTNNCNAIAMVTDYKEGYSSKCSRYLPENGDTKIAGEYSITTKLDESEETAQLRELGIKVTKVFITRNKETKTVTHYHYPNWADHQGGVAKVVAALVKALLKKETNPVIHCSAGIGRSGTTATTMGTWAKINDGVISPTLVFDEAKSLRSERRGCIQSTEQYQTVYAALQELVKSSLSDQSLHTEIKIKCSVSYPDVLTIRGQGDGKLSWDKSLPFQMSGPDTYVYSMKGVTGKVEYKVLLNDTVWETGQNHTFETGKAQEIKPALAISTPVICILGDPGKEVYTIRGTGPGMSWDKDTPLEKVNGKFVFRSNEKFESFEFKVLRNGKWEVGQNHKVKFGEPAIVFPSF